MAGQRITNRCNRAGHRAGARLLRKPNKLAVFRLVSVYNMRQNSDRIRKEPTLRLCVVALLLFSATYLSGQAPPTITVYSLSPVTYALGATAGPDGALWFTGSQIGRITTAGVITEYPVGAASAITAGPDGALWYAAGMVNGPQIGRIAITGNGCSLASPCFTQYPLPAGSGGFGYFSAITTGPDGAVWFTENSQFGGANEIGRITTTGTGCSVSSGMPGAPWKVTAPL